MDFGRATYVSFTVVHKRTDKPDSRSKHGRMNPEILFQLNTGGSDKL